MQGKGTKALLLAAAAAASLVALGAGSAASAASAELRIPELGDGDLPVATKPAPAKSRAPHAGRRGARRGCDGEAYVSVSNGRLGTAMC